MNDSISEPSQKVRVLCVEDDKDTCELIGLLFPNYEVAFAHTVGEGITLFESRRFDLCVLDNWLPDGSGIELCRKIRVVNSTVPIVFASAVGYQAEIQQAFDAGAQEYLVKPYEPEKLQKIVKKLLEKN